MILLASSSRIGRDILKSGNSTPHTLTNQSKVILSEKLIMIITKVEQPHHFEM